MSNAENPRAVRGSNEAPDAAQRVTDQMAADYAGHVAATHVLLDEARALPKVVANEGDLQKLSALVIRIRDKAKDADALRVQEKEPYLRGGQAVDGFFKSEIIEKLEKTNSILTKMANDYQRAKLAEERRIQDEQRRDAERVRQETAKREREEREAAEAAEAAAARARKTENIDKQNAIAEQHRQEEANARVEAQLAAQAAEDARIAQTAKSAELVRSRFDDGALATMKQVGYTEVTDRDLLDKDKLWPFIKDEHLAMALKAYGKTVGFKKPMAGAVIEMRDETVIR